MIGSHDPRLIAISPGARPPRRAQAGRVRVPDAVRHPQRRARPARRRGPPDARLHRVRHRLVRLLHAPPRGEARPTCCSSSARWSPRAEPPRPTLTDQGDTALMDAVTQVPAPVNEPVHAYAPGSPERARLEAKLKELAENPIELPMTIGGVKRMGGGERFDVVQPHNHKAVIGTFAGATQQDAQDAIDAALAAAPGVARDVLRRPRRDHPARRRAAGRPVARDARRLHHARPVEDRAAGRDRHPLRARRLLALQRQVRPQTCSPSSRRPTRRACGTGWTTARSRASSTRSRRSTSPPSRATCPPPPP